MVDPRKDQDRGPAQVPAGRRVHRDPTRCRGTLCQVLCRLQQPRGHVLHGVQLPERQRGLRGEGVPLLRAVARTGDRARVHLHRASGYPGKGVFRRRHVGRRPQHRHRGRRQLRARSPASEVRNDPSPRWNVFNDVDGGIDDDDDADVDAQAAANVAHLVVDGSADLAAAVDRPKRRHRRQGFDSRQRQQHLRRADRRRDRRRGRRERLLRRQKPAPERRRQQEASQAPPAARSTRLQ